MVKQKAPRKPERITKATNSTVGWGSIKDPSPPFQIKDNKVVVSCNICDGTGNFMMLPDHTEGCRVTGSCIGAPLCPTLRWYECQGCDDGSVYFDYYYQTLEVKFVFDQELLEKLNYDRKAIFRSLKETLKKKDFQFINLNPCMFFKLTYLKNSVTIVLTQWTVWDVLEEIYECFEMYGLDKVPFDIEIKQFRTQFGYWNPIANTSKSIDKTEIRKKWLQDNPNYQKVFHTSLFENIKTLGSLRDMKAGK